jgi:transcriptional regulator with XRE-family HTH domain
VIPYLFEDLDMIQSANQKIISTARAKIMIDTYFQKALNYVIDEMGQGAQTEIARRIKKRQSYISMLASGQKKGSETTRREIAKTLGYSYEKFLLLGKLLSEKRNINFRDFSSSKVIDNLPTLGYTAGNQDAAGVEPVKIPVYSSRH